MLVLNTSRSAQQQKSILVLVPVAQAKFNFKTWHRNMPSLIFLTIIKIMPLLENCPSGSGVSMGIGGNIKNLKGAKRRNRWMFSYPDVAGVKAEALPPKSSARPGLSFKEVEFQHLNESIWYPMKPDWKPISIVLYDFACNSNPVFSYIRNNYYDPTSEDTLQFPADLKQDAQLEVYDGCGTVLETWTFENAYPQNIEWGELDMESSDIVLVTMTLRYDRAFVET